MLYIFIYAQEYNLYSNIIYYIQLKHRINIYLIYSIYLKFGTIFRICRCYYVSMHASDVLYIYIYIYIYCLCIYIYTACVAQWLRCQTHKQ